MGSGHISKEEPIESTKALVGKCETEETEATPRLLVWATGSRRSQYMGPLPEHKCGNEVATSTGTGAEVCVETWARV